MSAPSVHTTPQPSAADPGEKRPGDDGAARRERARQAVTQGAKAAGFTAAGLAGGALLASRNKPSRKLSIAARRKRPPAIRAAIAKRLP